MPSIRGLVAVLAPLLILSAGCLGTDSPGGEASDGATAPSDERTPDSRDEGKTNTSAEPNGTPEPSGPVLHIFNGSVNGFSEGQLSPVPCASSGCEHQWPFEMRENATGLIAEAAWDSSEELNLVLRIPSKYCEGTNVTGSVSVAPECDNPEPYEGPSPGRVDVTSDQRLGYSGEWTVDVRASQSAEEVPFTVYISVFYNQTPPRGYSALPPS